MGVVVPLQPAGQIGSLFDLVRNFGSLERYRIKRRINKTLRSQNRGRNFSLRIVPLEFIINRVNTLFQIYYGFAISSE